MNRNLGFRSGFEKVEWKSTTNGAHFNPRHTAIFCFAERQTPLIPLISLPFQKALLR